MERAQKLELIKGIIGFGEQELGLHFNGSFSHLERNGPYFYLYASSKSIVGPPRGYEGEPVPYKYSWGTNKASAIFEKKSLEDMGNVTLLYESPASASGGITDKLLSQPPEGIAVIVLHEGFHDHLEQGQLKIPYSLVESTADVIAINGSIEYAKHGGGINIAELVKMKDLHERLVEFVNRRRHILDGSSGNIGHSFYEECDKELASILSNAGPTTRDRFNYPVNNAYFIRNRDYCADYPLVSSLFLSLESSRKLINFVSHLPNDYEAAKGGIEARLHAQIV